MDPSIVNKRKRRRHGLFEGNVVWLEDSFFSSFFDHFIPPQSIQIYIIMHLSRSRSRSMDGWVLVMGKVLSDQASFPPITISLSSSSSSFIFICFINLLAGSTQWYCMQIGVMMKDLD